MSRKAEHRFAGRIGESYALTREVAPYYEQFQRSLARRVAAAAAPGEKFFCLELGCGDGFTTELLLEESKEIIVIAVDHEPQMVAQAKSNLEPWIAEKRLDVVEADALEYLQLANPSSFDVVASALTMHNFWSDYRAECAKEILRVLKPGGLFANADRYALSAEEHHELVVSQAKRFFEVLTRAGRSDLIQEWILHLLSDDHPDRIMRESDSLTELATLGFSAPETHERFETEAILTARKPQ